MGCSVRSEEHTSELQSRPHLVCRLLLEKKNSGTGFCVDKAGLIITNQHVIGPSDLISVQFDPQRKVSATVLAFDPDKYVAVLWANTSAFPEMITAPIAKSEAGKESVIEGERVFTIGSPLSQRKILTSGMFFF